MNLKSQLKEFEDTVPYVYLDSLGFSTIGTGRLVDKRKGGGLSPAEMDFMLDNDITAKTAEVRAAFPWYDHLSEPRQAVLVGMAFQMGIGGLKGFPRMLAAVRDAHYATAAEEMRTSTWAKQTPVRAKRLASQMETGAWA